ncbi:MAG: Murein-DD-endopeptidase [Burkholderiaceae bacterium]|jgi:D-alanyl-D-alanine endopeptidase (penicillin-binding protein 7)|nr:MAG: Murein-DD-endopeptidase [Burkholderiaceae bacterium]
MPLHPVVEARRAFNRLLQIVLLLAFAGLMAAPAAQAAGTHKKTAKKAVHHSTHATRHSVAKSTTHARGKRVRVVVQGKRRSVVHVAYVPAPPSVGQLDGLHATEDPLDLKSGAALVMDQDTHEVLFSKNDQTVLPIASLSKLMTGLLISESGLPMDQPITITEDDVDTIKHSRSRLRVGTVLTRGELLHLALMASENRAAHALARTYPGGEATFVALMNAKAKELGMTETHYVEPTGLSSENRSSALDLAKLVNVAYRNPMLRELTTSHSFDVDMGRRTVQFNNTNRLVKNPTWDIGLQKTGFINEAGHCLLMQVKVAGRKLIMVFLDSAGSLSRFADAERVRRWVETRPVNPIQVSVSDKETPNG